MNLNYDYLLTQTLVEVQMSSRTKIIVVATDKGGPGKTTATKHIGKGLHDKGLNVYLYDGDQSNNLTNFEGRRLETMGSGDLNFPKVSPFPLKLKENPRRWLLRNSPEADVIIVDMVAKLSIVHAELMASADIIIVPTQMDSECIDGTIATFDFIEDRGIIEDGSLLPIALVARMNWDKTSPAVRQIEKNNIEFNGLPKFDSITTPRQKKYINSSAIGMTVLDMVKNDNTYEQAAFENNKFNKELIKLLGDIDKIEAGEE